ncbi:MAG: hypothetical protein HOH89_08005, partial [Alphaproteobacteria bacterium]|nr:hypothetical protein [Alphaproteobacteria bacterium]
AAAQEQVPEAGAVADAGGAPAPGGFGGGGRGARGGGGGGAPGAGAAPVETRTARVFLLDADGVPQPMTVTVGISDTGFTELVRGELADGQQLVVGASAATLAAQANAANEGGGRFRFGF